MPPSTPLGTARFPSTTRRPSLTTRTTSRLRRMTGTPRAVAPLAQHSVHNASCSSTTRHAMRLTPLVLLHEPPGTEARRWANLELGKRRTPRAATLRAGGCILGAQHATDAPQAAANSSPQPRTAIAHCNAPCTPPTPLHAASDATSIHDNMILERPSLKHVPIKHLAPITK